MADDASAETEDRTAADYRDVADAVRARVDLFGKALAAIATIGTTAVGLDKISDLFPGSWRWGLLACLSLGVAAGAAIAVAVRLMNAAGPVVILSDLDLTSLEPHERAEVRPVFLAAAERFGYTTLRGLERRERALRSAASRAPDESERTRRTALADRVKTELDLALARGQLVVVRRRATRAVGDETSRWLYGAVIAGLIVFALAADRASSTRLDAAGAKACAEARDAKATSDELERAQCTVSSDAGEDQPAATSPADEARKRLLPMLTDCVTSVENAPDETVAARRRADCRVVIQAVSALAAPATSGQ
jgi:hypothetical protein